MPDFTQKVIPVKIQLDTSEVYRDAFNAQFLKNVRPDLNINSDANSVGNQIFQGANVKKLTPIQSPEIVCPDIELPTGNNVCTGAFSSPTTSEVYFEVWNDSDNHSLWVYSTELEICRKVYEGACLGYRFAPEYHFPAHRTALFIVYDSDTEGNRTIKNKFYVSTDGVNWQFFIDVESAIATDSYDPIAFPYFQTYYPYCDPCEFIQLGVRVPDCPKVLPFDDDTMLQDSEGEPENNNLKQKAWYFATSFIDVWGRHSVISPYSALTYLDGGDCSADAADTKCFRLLLDAGSAIVDKIVVYYSNDGINWFIYDTIDKWEDCTSPPTEHFWERTIKLKNYYAPVTSSPPNECEAVGEFSTSVFTWDLAQSPAIEFCDCTWSVVINGFTYESTLSPPICSIQELKLWLSSLLFDNFITENDLLIVSSDSNVYGDITFNCDSPQTFSPEVDQSDIQTGVANTFIYVFCGNKGCIPVAVEEVARIFDDLPIASVAQAVIDDKLAYGDNLRNYDNFICEPSKISITAVQDTEICGIELVDVTVDMVIHNYYATINNFIYSPAGSTDIAFGGVGRPSGGFPNVVDYEDETIPSYKQQILNPYTGTDEDVHGFIGGMRGTDLKVVSKQYRINDLEHTWFFDNVDHNPATRSLMIDIMGGNYVIQRFQFKGIPKGNYIFEVYSHLATSFSDCEGTSTYILGEIAPINYIPGFPITVANFNKELHIFACSGDVHYENYLVLADLTKPKADISVAPSARAISGYLKEEDTNVPVELAYMDISSGSTTAKSENTDHNGFYWATDDGDFTVDLKVLDPNDCVAKVAHVGGANADAKQLLQIDMFVDNPAISDFNECGHEIVSGTITTCDDIPIAGVRVALTQTGRYAVTDANGVYSILAHDNAFQYVALSETRKIRNQDFLVIAQQGSCLFTICNTCSTCINWQHVDWTNSCFHCSSASPPETPTDIYDFTFDFIPQGIPGVKTGGTYQVAIIGYDYLDRNNTAQVIATIQVPTIQSNSVFAPYQLVWSIIGQMNFPSWVKKIRFAIRGNNYEFLLSWVANKVEFVDASGNLTSPSIAANIKIYIDSLNDFNTQNFTNTNTVYQFVPGDRIRFITNNGNVYAYGANSGLIDLPVSSVVNGNVILIPFDARLAGLQAGATFELYRVPVCTTAPIFYETCPTIPVIDGEPIITSGTINFYDTFWYFRNIPTTDQDGLPINLVPSHPFESRSISDFWGANAFTIGRPFVENVNQRQTWYLDEIAYSDTLLFDGVINGLGTWRTQNRKDYFVQGGGGIVGMKAQTGLLMAILENNWFIINIAQNLLQVTAAGNVQANPDYLGNQQQKIGSVFGCQLKDTNTILFVNEWAFWMDVNRSAACLSNYQTVWDITKEQEGVSVGGMKGYFIEKCKQIQSLRNEDGFDDAFMFFHAAFNPKVSEITLTSFSRSGSPPTIDYVNTERDYDVTIGETVSFNLAGYFSGTYSFVPEMMLGFSSGVHGQNFMSWRMGKNWLHHPIITTGITYNNFYGEQCEAILEFVMNGGEQANTTQKKFLALRIECKDLLFYSDKIYTQSGQFSQLPIEDSEMIENYSEAAFLCDINTLIVNGLSALEDGNSLMGSWVKIRLIVDPNRKGEYFELSGIIISAAKSF